MHKKLFKHGDVVKNTFLEAANSLFEHFITRAQILKAIKEAEVSCNISRGVTRGKWGHKSPGAKSLWGHHITAVAPNDCAGRRKSQPCHKYFVLQRSTFGPKDLRFEHEGVKLASCPGRHLTLLRPWIQGMRKNGYACGGANEEVYRRVWVRFPPLWRVDWYVAQSFLFIRMVFEDMTAKDLLTSLPGHTREKDILMLLWAMLARQNCRSSTDVGDIATKVMSLWKLRSQGQGRNEG